MISTSERNGSRGAGHPSRRGAGGARGVAYTGAIALIGRLRFDEPFEDRRMWLSRNFAFLASASYHRLHFLDFSGARSRRPLPPRGRSRSANFVGDFWRRSQRSRPRPEARWALRFQEGARRPMRAPEPSVGAEDQSTKWREDYCFLCFGSITPVCVGAWVLFMLVPILFFILVRAISGSAEAPRPAAHSPPARRRSARGSSFSLGRRQ